MDIVNRFARKMFGEGPRTAARRIGANRGPSPLDEKMAGAEQMAFGWDSEPEDPPARARSLRQRLQQLAADGIYLGTSSWNYPGWLGQIYDPRRYSVRGRFAQRKFEQECLAEYAGIFPTVGGDFSFYQFPSALMWQRIFEQLPAGYKLGLKVPEDITAYRFGNHARYGERAGMVNAHFMDAALVRDELLAPLEPYRDKIGPVMFEFGAIHDGPFLRVEHFAERLAGLLGALPQGRFALAVEVRNRGFLEAGGPYLSCLQRHGAAHCVSSWTHMPSAGEQLDIPGILTAPQVAARFLLRPGRTYEQAVELFSPYERIKEVYPEGREALRRLIERCRQQKLALFAFVNNRFEGNAVETIEAVLDTLAPDPGSPAARDSGSTNPRTTQEEHSP
jgi:uncharacterized protein YecE (DUF72 family)